jgi:hypothetical protein
MEGMQRSTSKENSSKIAHELDPIPIGSAALTIVDRQIQGDSAEPTVIQSLSFKVELVVPQSIKLPLDLAAKAHSATCPTLPSTINYTK